jgi:dephospho-CoA kinase
MIIIGITGTLGAGKGTIVEYLLEQKNFAHYSVRAYLTEEIERRGLPVNRDSMVIVANDLRATHSPDYIVGQLYQQAVMGGKHCVIESIRTPGEVELLRSKENFCLLAVDASPESRYQRITARGSSTDHVSFETFLDNEKREMDSTDPNKQNIRKCIEMADYRLLNDGSVEELCERVEQILLSLNK